MLTINDLVDINREPISLTLPHEKDFSLDGKGLMVFPALIDPHVHFRTPGMEYKENWLTASKAALKGGYTMVFDMPNTIPPTITETFFNEKNAIIQEQLEAVNIPLRYRLFFGADKNHFNEIAQVQREIIGIKVFMGCSTGNLVMDDDESLAKLFKIAAELNLLVAVHAEDEKRLHERKKLFAESKNYADHSKIRDETVASIAVRKAIDLVRRFGTKLYILHVSSRDELDLIRKAKEENLPVYAETTPHHLFLDTDAYGSLNGFAVVNPPLREAINHVFLWEAIHEGIIDTIGSDHAPHLPSEKKEAFGVCPSGMPGIETTLPLLLTAYHENKISLKRIVELTSLRARAIFILPDYQDYTLVDLNKIQTIQNDHLQSKCRWSAFAGKTLQGFPRYVVLQDKLYDLETM